MENLIVYFSKDNENYVSGKIEVLQKGNAKVIAEQLNQELESDIFELIPVIKYPDDYKECVKVSIEEQKQNTRPEYINEIDTIKYNKIYFIYPIWCGTYPNIINTFIEKHNLENKTIIPIATHEGSFKANSVNDFKKYIPNSNVLDGYAIKGSEANNSINTIKQIVTETK